MNKEVSEETCISYEGSWSFKDKALTDSFTESNRVFF